VFDRYTHEGNVTGEDVIQALSSGQPIPVTGPPRPESRTHPLVNTVSDFG
jgi:hypothetical protein